MISRNQFQKENSEKAIKAIQEMKKSPMNYEKEFERHKQLQKKAEDLQRLTKENPKGYMSNVTD